MTRTSVLGILMTSGLLTMSLAAFQQPAAPMVVDVEKLKENLYVMKGGGGNSAVFIGTDGVTVVDTKNPGWGAPLLEKISVVIVPRVQTNAFPGARATGASCSLNRRSTGDPADAQRRQPRPW